MERDIVLHVDAGRGFQLVIAHVRGDPCRNVGRSSGDQLRHFAENAELSAAGQVLFKKRYRAFVKRLAVRDDHLVIEAEPDPDLISLNTSHVLHDALVTEMVGDMVAGEHIDGVGIVLLTLRHRVGKVEICGPYRVDDKRVSRLGPLRERRAEVLEVLFIGLVVLLPGVVLGIMVRVVAFSLTSLGVGIEMLAGDVHAAGILKLGDPLYLPRRSVPSAAAVHFGYRELLARLSADGAELLCAGDVLDVAAEVVNSRNMLIEIERHNAAAAHHAAAETPFLNSVPRQLYAVFVAPVVYLFHEAGEELLVADKAVVVSVSVAAVKPLNEEVEKPVPHVVAVFLLKIDEEGVRPRSTVSEILRLVGEEARHRASEILRVHLLFVHLMGAGDEFLGDLAVHRVNV